MSAITRTFSVQYGSITVSTAASGYALEGPVLPQFGYRRVTWSWGCIVYGSSPSDLESKSAALIAAIRIPRQNLTVTQGAQSFPYSEASKTGYNMSGAIERQAGGIFDTHVTREFSCSVTVELPATLNSDDGVFDYAYVTTTEQSGQRTISLTGEVTTNGTLLAEDQYEAKIAAIVSAVQAAVDNGATFEEQLEERGIERFDFEMRFRRVYREQIYKDSLANFNEAAIKDARITSSVSTVYAQAAEPGLKLPTEITLQYEAIVDKAQSTDLAGLWIGVALPLLKSIADELAAAASGGEPIYKEIRPTYSPTGQILSGFVRFAAFNSFILLSEITETMNVSTSGRKLAVYGDPYERVRVPGIGSASAQVVASVTVQGDRSDALDGAQRLSIKPSGSPGTGGFTTPIYRPLTRQEYSNIGAVGGDWTLEGEAVQYIGPIYEGDPALPVTTCILTRVYDYDKESRAQAFGGGGGGGAGGGGGGGAGGGRKILSPVYDGNL